MEERRPSANERRDDRRGPESYPREGRDDRRRDDRRREEKDPRAPRYPNGGDADYR